MSFRPSWQATLVLALLAGLCAGLGNWQWQRAAAKQALVRAFDEAPEIPQLTGPGVGRFARIALRGEFDPARHFLIDNRIFGSRPGVHVLTPFTTRQGETLLVNRGWLPMAPDRRSLPLVPTAAVPLSIRGTLDELTVPGRQLGEPDRLSRTSWPQLMTYPDLGDMAAALDADLYPLVLLLDADSPGGFEDRDWRPVYVTPQRHRGYAFQWYSMATAVLVAWIFLGVRRARIMARGGAR
jgi:cytochrome oxidase assembly protein ShyY1